MAATVVFVHGAWHGAWCWELVLPLLEPARVPSVAIDLPGHGASTEPLSDFAGDVAAVRAVLDDLESDIVVCAHSFGGAVVTQAAAGHPRVGHLLYLTAFPLEPGETVLNAAADEIDPGLAKADLVGAVHIQGSTLVVDPDLAIPVFYNDCSPEVAHRAVERLGPQALAEVGEVTQAAWVEIDSTYVVCTEDRAITPAHQRVLATRCTQRQEWPTGHSPFLSRPELVAELCIATATSLPTG